MKGMRILARYQAMAENELLAMIPASEYNRIKAEDSTPQFRAYVVGHEGQSSGKLVGGKTIIARWFSAAVRSLYEKLKAGIKLFHDHGETNEHEGRVSIGEIVGRGLQVIKDKLTAIAVAYIYPDFRGIPLDVASIEADIVFKGDAKTGTYTSEVERVTGIALGNSAINHPGFPGATLLAQVQAFAARQSNKKYSRFNREGEGDTMTLDEVLEFIRTNKTKPSEIYDTDELAGDPIIKGFVKDASKGTNVNEYHARKRVEDEAAKAKTDYEAKIKVLEDKTAKLDADIALTKVPGLFKKEAEARKLTDQQKKFIEKRLDKFKTTAPEKTESEFKAHLDKELDEFKTTAELFGIKIEKADEKPNGDGKEKTGAEPSAGATTIEDKYLDPAQNPMIPKV